VLQKLSIAIAARVRRWRCCVRANDELSPSSWAVSVLAASVLVLASAVWVVSVLVLAWVGSVVLEALVVLAASVQVRAFRRLRPER
jgi:hypothetical protein